MLEMIKLLLQGFVNSFLITALSMIFPLTIGIVITIFSSKFKVANKIFSWLSLPFECLCPIFLCSGIYFLIPMKIIPRDIWSFVVAVFVLSLCFMGYMPARCVESYSPIKNILYNGIGLIKNIFVWSFFVSGCTMMNTDLYRASLQVLTIGFNSFAFLISLIIVILFLFVLELARRFIKQFMK